MYIMMNMVISTQIISQNREGLLWNTYELAIKKLMSFCQYIRRTNTMSIMVY